MAKLPKVKNKQEEVEEDVIREEVDGTTETTSEDQGDAVDSIINHTAETVADSTGSEEDSEDDADEGESGETNENTDSKGEDFGVTIAPPKNPTPTKATTVKVATVCDHSCYIGGKPYHFKKGVPTNVPEPVKQILKNAGLLAAL